MISKIKEWLKGRNKSHVHAHNKPIASLYWSFNTRRIIYECGCGDRVIREVYKGLNEPFPILTNYGNSNIREFYDLLNSKKEE